VLKIEERKKDKIQIAADKKLEEEKKKLEEELDRKYKQQ
jgi:hypothetical protein